MKKNGKTGKNQAPIRLTDRQKASQSVDRMRKKQALGGREKTICLTMIVKNEEKNMVRLLNSLKPLIDCGSIVDTGSTDNTVKVIQKWSKDNGINIKVHSEPFKNFGYNRTHSFVMAKQTFPDADYALLSDADFVWEIDVINKFDKRLLIDEVYKIQQYNDSMQYDNIRLLKMSLDFVCKLRTHEYWRIGDKKFEPDIHHRTITTIRIHDIEDGGCKEDKYERDERLLLEDVADPENSKEDVTRAKYYLAQTYRCLKRYEDSIKWYEERILEGGWPEEIWHAKYQVGFCYEKLGWQIKHCDTLLKKDKMKECDIEYMEKWNPDKLDKEAILRKAVEYFTTAAEHFMKAYNYRPTRAESLAACAKMFREMNSDEMRRKAYDIAVIGNKIPMTKDTLFVEIECYDWKFDYEISICAWYFDDLKDEGREAQARLLEHDDLPEGIEKQVRENAHHYL